MKLIGILFGDRTTWREARLRPGFAHKVDANGDVWIAPAHLVDRYQPGDPRLLNVHAAAADGILVVGEPLDELRAKRAEIDWLLSVAQARGSTVLTNCDPNDVDGELRLVRRAVHF